MTWPPDYSGAAGNSGPRGALRRFPPAGWPSKGQLDYGQQLLIVGLLVLALPYIVRTLITDPGELLGAGPVRRLVVRREG